MTAARSWPPAGPALLRSGATLTLYAALACLGYLLTGLGAVLPELRAERALSRAEVALYPSTFAFGLLVVGVVGDRVTRALGRAALPAALAAMGAGAVALAAAGDRLTGAAGALLFGIGGAGLVQLVPMGLRAEHGDRAAVAIGEANAAASAASVLAPLLVGAALGGGLGWRAGYLGVPLAALLVLLALQARSARTAAPSGAGGERRRDAAARPPRAFLGWWLDLVLVVSVEFCMVFWAADFLRAEGGLGPGAATAAAAGFIGGMAVGRVAVGPVTRLQPVPLRLLAGAASLATTGFVLLWTGGSPLPAVAGLVVTGLGVALLYPVTLAQALAAWPAEPDRAAARCVLASGLAVGAAPLALGALADAVTLRTAVLLAPLLLLAFLWRCAARLAAARRPGR